MSGQPQTLHRRSTLLVVVDVQQRINRAMSDQRHVPRIAALIDGCRSLEVPVVATEQYPQGLGTTISEIADRLPDPPITKLAFSCLRDGASRAAIVADDVRCQVVVAGIEAHVCVLQTALDLLAAGREVHVPYDAVGSRRVTDADWALRRMASAGAIVTTTESVLFELVERCATDEFRRVAALVREIPVDSRET